MPMLLGERQEMNLGNQRFLKKIKKDDTKKTSFIYIGPFGMGRVKRYWRFGGVHGYRSSRGGCR